ncbi:MAG: general secretion pathway protein GspC [Tatlockia sp.]|nr:general secretion pathway protein GspC [Tatlockia sp.]
MKNQKYTLSSLTDSKKIAAIVILVMAFFAFIWEILSAFPSTDPIRAINKPLNLIDNRQSINLNSPLFTTALFGDYLPVNLSDAVIKQSSLDIQVVGIMFAAKESESQVVLRVGGGKENYYVLGDTLPGGAIIKRISSEGVVVLHNGALESLSLPKNELIFDEPAKPLIKDAAGSS